MIRTRYLYLVLLILPGIVHSVTAQDCYDYGGGCPYIVQIQPLGDGPTSLCRDGDILAAASGATVYWVALDAEGAAAVEGSYAASANILSMAIEGDLLYLALGVAGVEAVDFSDPRNPSLLASVPALETARDVDVEGGYLYVVDADTCVDEDEPGLRVLDVSNPAAPAEVLANGHPCVRYVEVENGFCWEFAYYHGIRCYDMANPAVPVEVYSSGVGSYFSTYLPPEVSAGVLRYTEAVSDPEGIWPDSYLFFCYDVTDPAAPVRLSSTGPAGDWRFLTGDESYSYLWREDEILVRGFGATDGEYAILRVPGVAGVLACGAGLLYGGLGDSLVVLDRGQVTADPSFGEQYFTLYDGYLVNVHFAANHFFVHYNVFDSSYIGGPNYYNLDIIELQEGGELGESRRMYSWPYFDEGFSGLATFGDYLYTGYGVYDWTTSELVSPFHVNAGILRIGNALYARTSAGIQVYDLADPLNPVLTATLFGDANQRYEPLVSNGETAFTRNLVDVAHGPNVETVRQLVCIDVTDPLNPVPLANLEDTGKVITVDGTTVYLDDEDRIQLVDASDPSQPALAGSFARPDGLNDLKARGGMIYLGLAGGWIQIGDASDPASVVLGEPENMTDSVTRLGLHDWGFYTIQGAAIRSWMIDCTDPGPEWVSGVEEPRPVLSPVEGGILLFRPYPNPFNPSATIRFEMENSGPVDLAVFDLAGRRVATLIEELLDVGPHARIWDGCDDCGRAVAAGTYLIRLRCGAETSSRKIVLVK